jgi:hypothetical protein
MNELLYLLFGRSLVEAAGFYSICTQKTLSMKASLMQPPVVSTTCIRSQAILMQPPVL